MSLYKANQHNLLHLDLNPDIRPFHAYLNSAGGSVLVQMGEHVRKLGGGANNDRLMQVTSYLHAASYHIRSFSHVLLHTLLHFHPPTRTSSLTPTNTSSPPPPPPHTHTHRRQPTDCLPIADGPRLVAVAKSGTPCNPHTTLTSLSFCYSDLLLPYSSKYSNNYLPIF